MVISRWPAKDRVSRTTFFAVLTSAFLLSSASTSMLSFAVAPRHLSSASNRPLCGFVGRTAGMASVAVQSSLRIDRSWGAPATSPVDRLSPREWLRMYRTLGLPEDATKQQVMKATTRLRKKYAENEAAAERVEAANLWIMTKMLAKKEEAVRAKQQANRIRELGDSPRRLFHKYIAGYVPPSIRQMIEPPNAKHFQWASGLLGTFALIGLCVPTQAANFVSLAAAATMGLVYQRNRPEPVKDDMGNVGEVRKPKMKEMGACITLVLLGAGLGALISFILSALLSLDQQVAFCGTTCFLFWLIALFFKVFEVFDS